MLFQKKIKELKQGFVYHPKYFQDEITQINEITSYPLILQKKESNSRKFLDSYMLERGVSLNSKMEVVSQELVLEFSDAGFGVGFVMIDAAKKNYPKLKELKVNKQLPKIPVYLATNKNMNLPFASKKFLEYFEK